MQPEGSLYEDQGVGSFHKPPLGYGHLKSSRSEPKLLFDHDALPTTPLSTPDVTTLLTQSLAEVHTSLITSQAPTPNRFLRGDVTSEQEMYAKGFLEALDELHGGNDRQPEAIMDQAELKYVSSNSRMDAHHSSQELAQSSQYISGPNPSLEAVAPTYVTATMDYIPNIAPPSHSEPSSAYSSASSFTQYTPPVISHFAPMIDYNGYSAQPVTTHSQTSGINGSLPTQMMKELQRVVPADIKTQEQMKVERKKARNRIAASKCRQRRLQRESDLQGKVRILREHNQELNHEVTGLKVQINNMKKALVQHMKGGCQVSLPDGYGLRSDSCSSSE